MNEKKIRCIHIFPRFENNNSIEKIREKYDELFQVIEPHITLVFPFASNLEASSILKNVKDLLKNEEPFKITASGIEGVENHGYYLFLKIKEGSEKIKKLHYKIHEGILKPYQSPWTKDGSYKPHITLGRFETMKEMKAAAKGLLENQEIYSTTVARVYVETIGEKDESIIEGSIDFGKK